MKARKVVKNYIRKCLSGKDIWWDFERGPSSYRRMTPDEVGDHNDDNDDNVEDLDVEIPGEIKFIRFWDFSGGNLIKKMTLAEIRMALVEIVE